MLGGHLTWEICIIGVSLSTFTLINLATKSYKHKTDLLLCSWLVLLNIPLLHSIFSHLKFNFPEFNLYSNPTLNLLHGPILYLYVRMLISEKIHLSASTLLHLIPFAFMYPLFITMSHPAPMVPLPDIDGLDVGPVGEGVIVSFFEPLFVHFGVLNGLFFGVYSIVTIYVLVKHQKNILGVFSQNDNQVSLRWIYVLPATFVILLLLNVVNESSFMEATAINALTLHMLSFTCFIVLLCFFGVKQKPVFCFRLARINTIGVLDKLLSQPVEMICDLRVVGDNKADISDENISNIIKKMQLHMKHDKPYLDPNFSVYSLAQALRVPRRVLSLTINNGLSKNFYQYVNEFRVEEVKLLLASQKEDSATILDIAFRCGFNSKSSFNSLFKQHCGITPSQYRKGITVPNSKQ